MFAQCCRHVWCMKCHSMASFKVLRLAYQSSRESLQHHKLMQNNTTSMSSWTLATARPPPSNRSVTSPMATHQSLLASMFSKTGPTSSCRSPFTRGFADGRRSVTKPQYRIDQEKEKERAILSEYERHYTPEKRYTSRVLTQEEIEDEAEMVEDFKPEDTFGALTNKFKRKFNVKGDRFDVEVDSDDEKVQPTLKPPGRRNTPIWYGNQMKKLVKEGKLMEAIDMLEVRMLKEDRVQPEEFNYNVLIGACGREGYTKKAFKLYNDMKSRGLTPSDVTFTSLFNACAESPWPLTDGISRLHKLHSQLKDKEIVVNQITQHAMIKAFAKCGDLPVAFDLFKELLDSGVKLKSQSFAFLLFACAGDKECGLMYAIEAWYQMLQRDIKPDVYIYNLLLRISRDCGIGDPEVASRLLLKPRANDQTKKLPAPTKKSRKVKGQRLHQPPDEGLKGQSHPGEMIEVSPLNVTSSDGESVAAEAPLRELTAVSHGSLVYQQQQLPNLLDPSPKVSSAVSLANVANPSDRLALLGGADGILSSMKRCGVTPDVKTLTLLMEGLPMTNWDEERLLEVVDEFKVKVDVDFFNAIIRRRSRRADLEGAKAILPLIHQHGLFPNLRTFVNLACECAKTHEGIQLLKDMKLAGLKPTVHIYGALITAAARKHNHRYLIELLNCMEKDEVSPNSLILQRLESMASFGDNPKKSNLSKSQLIHQDRLNQYRGLYIKWLDRMGLEETPHPWKKFHRPREGTITDAEARS
ncbi:pentatricopeptide repeat-containing protein 1, mitochondrial-like [Asterias amurensis]|uniref:pentatricopeptide repeat-containing protein 1, mitochondrial-like n=1 Tax=Asterias amurensis TaxID=7602 RepID=UPI003AB87E9B